MNELAAFEKQQYMNVETYRKSGEGVRTPVWFVEYAGELCFSTETASGKVKRMLRNPEVKVAPCKMNGDLLGDWHPATARFMQPAEIANVKKAYDHKYELQKKFFDFLGRARKRENVIIALTLNS